MKHIILILFETIKKLRADIIVKKKDKSVTVLYKVVGYKISPKHLLLFIVIREQTVRCENFSHLDYNGCKVTGLLI